MYFRSFFRVSAVAVVALVVAALPARAVPTHDVYILLDKGGSMGQANFDAQISTIGRLISDYGGQANSPMRFLIIDFETTSYVVHSLDDPQDLPSVLSALNSIVYTGGWTDTAGAVNLMLNEFNAFGETGNVSTRMVFTAYGPSGPVDVCSYAN